MMQFRRYFSAQPSLLDVVSKLRNQTSMSMALCRKAALESKLNYNLALEILSKTSNKPFVPNAEEKINFGKEGLIGIMGSYDRKCLVELRCDSDFVAQNTDFLNLADSIMSAILSNSNDNTSAVLLPSPFSKTIDETINLYRSKFRENIGLESVKIFESENDRSKFQIIGHYLHQKLGLNSGKIGSLIKIKIENGEHHNSVEELANLLARQVVALGDPQINIAKLMDSDYLFAPLGTVKNFIESLESKLKSKITVLDIDYVKIK